ncbi:hypothetical protein CIG19_13370 [Enterobacterales bacterium CwR94]|nr:hypothetical protein CIG19_13370 [Enterobacterales bacterium CwR94]
MQLTPILAALRSHCPLFAGRVAGATDRAYLLTLPAPTLPAAWVLAGEDRVLPQRSATDYWQALTETFVVIVAIDDVAAEQEEDAFYDQLHLIRQQLWQALLGWAPDSEGGAIQYVSGPAYVREAQRLWYQFTFSRDRDISESDSRQQRELAALGEFEGGDIRLDYIDPGDGPDGKPEHHLTFNLRNLNE